MHDYIQPPKGVKWWPQISVKENQEIDELLNQLAKELALQEKKGNETLQITKVRATKILNNIRKDPDKVSKAREILSTKRMSTFFANG